jgi:hypothetical protein
VNSRIIVICTIIFFLVSALFLAYTENHQSDENFQKDWWVLSFNDPKNTDVNFIIENHSQKSSFHWELISGTEIISEGDAKIAKGSAWKSNVQTDNLSGKAIVRVSSGSDKKEIYKNFNK